MKLNKVLISTVAVAAVFCAFASAKAKAPKNVANRPELIDWQGATLGKEIPDWVMAVNDGDNAKVGKELKIDESEDMIFVVNGRGTDLDFVKTWVDNIDARREISTSISQVVATTAEAAMSGMQGVDETTKKKMYNDSVNMASAIELSGLSKKASYWIKTRTLPVGMKAKKAKESDYSIEYTYFVVFTMNKKMYQTQVDHAMNKVESFTSEENYLKKVLAEKISQTILPGNTVRFDASSAKAE